MINPITIEQSNDFNEWLRAHNLCKKASKKRMRVYRTDNVRRSRCSRDFVYVVSADDYRNDLDGVHNTLLELSQKVMDEETRVKNEEYINKMDHVEERLMLEHDIEMNWFNAKSVSFKKIVHAIRDTDVLELLNMAAQTRDDYDVHNHYLERFKMGAKIEEFGIVPPYDWVDWNETQVVKRGDKIIYAYSKKDMVKLSGKSFKVGLFDKFGYNLDICEDDVINEVVAKAEAWQKAYQDSLMVTANS